MRAPIIAAALVLAGPVAHADDLGECYSELESRGVAFKRTKKPGIVLAVEITGPLAGVAVHGPDALVIDCSLAVSLHDAASYARALGFEEIGFSSAYSRRTIRGTNRPSKHSFGLAIDVHNLAGSALGTVRIDKDYEQGLGDAIDCIGAPMTQGGAALKILQCQLVRSGLFHLVLSPDYDDAHHDHFHLEAKPWRDRSSLRSATPAIH